MARQVPYIGVPFPVLVNDNNLIQVPVYDVLVNLDAQVNVNASITGVSGTGGVGTSTASVSGTITGVEGTGGVGTTSISISETLSSLNTTAELGTLTVEADIDIALSGIAASCAITAPTFSVARDFTLTGIETASAIEAVSQEVQETLASILASAAIGTPTVNTEINIQLFSGITAFPVLGNPLVIVRPNSANVRLSGIGASTASGLPHVSVGKTLTGLAGSAHLGSLQPIRTASGMGFVDLESVTAVVPPNNIQVNLRWSDDQGASWAGSRATQFGTMGAYTTSLQFRRLGMARDRIFEISWSAPIPTALIGASLQVEEAAT